MLGLCKGCNRVYPEHYLTDWLCEDCRLDTWIPDWFEAEEDYIWIEAFKHSNATRRPMTGIEWFDKTNHLLEIENSAKNSVYFRIDNRR